MTKRFIITETDRNTILNLHSKQGYNLSEQTATVQNYTVQDIQNTLNRPPFNSNLTADNKFGPLTAGAIVKALDMVKTGQVGAAPQTITTKDATQLTAAGKTTGLAQSTPTLQTGPPSPSSSTQQSTNTQQPVQTQTTNTQQPVQTQTTNTQSSGKGDDSTAIE